MPRERTQPVCDALALAMRAIGVPEQILTDNGKVFTGRFAHPPVEVLFDRICRENGIEHLLTQPRSPTTTGKIERFHRTLRVEFDTSQVFRDPERPSRRWMNGSPTTTPTGRTSRSVTRPRPAGSTPTGDGTAGVTADAGASGSPTSAPARSGWPARSPPTASSASAGSKSVVGKHYCG